MNYRVMSMNTTNNNISAPNSDFVLSKAAFNQAMTQEEKNAIAEEYFNQGTPSWVRAIKDPYKRYSLDFMLKSCPDLAKIFGADFKNHKTDKGKGRGRCRNGKDKGKGKGKGVFDPLPLDSACYLIYGRTQSGKTALIKSTSVAHIMFSKCSTIVVLRNSRGDADQLKKRCEEFVKEHKAWMAKEAPGVACKTALSYVYAGTKSATNLRKLDSALKGDTPSMIITIANRTQMATIKSAIERVGDCRYVVAIDEADAVAYGSDTANFRQTLNDSILSEAGRIYAVTATSFDVVFTEDRIRGSTTIVMQNKKYYKGLWNIEKYALRTDAVPANGSNLWFGNDGNLVPILRDLNDRNVYGKPVVSSYSHCNVEMPIITLIKNTRLNALQLDLLKQIAHHPDLTNWEGLVYNGKGLYIFARQSRLLTNLPGRGKVGQTVEDFKNCLFFPGCNVSEGLQYFYKLNKKLKKRRLKRISHIAIVCGDLADRGISFVSSNYKWHINSMYYVPSSSSSVSDMVQAAGRLTGNFNDAIPLRLYAPRECLEVLTKGILLQEEVLDRVKDAVWMGRPIGTAASTMKINRRKVPTRRFGNQEAKMNVVAGSDGGVSREVYKGKLAEIKTENRADIPEAKVETKVVEEPVGNVRLIVRAYKNKGSVIQRLIDTFVTEDLRSLSITEIKRLVSSTLSISNYDHWDLGRSRKYKVVQKTPSGRYILCPDVVSALNLN